MHIVIDKIKQELVQPYKDLRKDFNTKFNKEEIFYALTNESPFYFKEESLVTLRILMIDDRGFRVLTNNGFIGIILPNAIHEDYNE